MSKILFTIVTLLLLVTSFLFGTMLMYSFMPHLDTPYHVACFILGIGLMFLPLSVLGGYLHRRALKANRCSPRMDWSHLPLVHLDYAPVHDTIPVPSSMCLTNLTDKIELLNVENGCLRDMITELEDTIQSQAEIIRDCQKLIDSRKPKVEEPCEIGSRQWVINTINEEADKLEATLETRVAPVTKAIKRELLEVALMVRDLEIKKDGTGRENAASFLSITKGIRAKLDLCHVMWLHNRI